MIRRRAKQLFALLLAALTLFGALSATAMAESGGTAENTEAGQTQGQSGAPEEQPGDGAEEPSDGEADASNDEEADVPDGEDAPGTGPEDLEPSAVEQVQALIDALPEAESVTAENRAQVEAQLAAIDQAKQDLTDEERGALDVTRYEAAAAALLALEGQVPEGTDSAPGGEGGPEPISSEETAYYDPLNGCISAHEATVIDGSFTFLSSGWYVVKDTVEISERITTDGDVNLILADSGSLTDNVGITVDDASSLTIWGQEKGTGKLTVDKNGDNNDRRAGIGADRNEASGQITINGGTIWSRGGNHSAGIGGGASSKMAYITINGGNVTAYSGGRGAGIGAGLWGSAVVTITGGTVYAEGKNNGCGIGGSSITNVDSDQPSGLGSATVIISGGNVTAVGAVAGVGIGGGSGSKVTVSGGTVSAKGGEYMGRNYADDIAGFPFSTGENGKAVIHTENQRIEDKTEQANWSGIFDGTVYGHVELDGDFTVGGGETLTIPEGASLTVPEGKTLTNNGTIENRGKIVNNGRITNAAESSFTNAETGSVENNGDFVTEEGANYQNKGSFKDKSYTVSFYSDGTVWKELVVERGKRIERQSCEKAGYTFAGWYTDPAFSEEWDFDRDTMPDNDLSLYAKWIAEPEKGTGSLTVQVTVSGDGADKDKKWHFRVELDDKNISGQYGQMFFTKGAAEFTLKHGQSATAKDLPEGVAYTVTETEKNRDGYTTSYTGEKGTVQKDRNLVAAFVNGKGAAASADAAKTGDGSQAALWMQAGILSLAGMGAALLPAVGRKKPVSGNGRQVKK